MRDRAAQHRTALPVDVDVMRMWTARVVVGGLGDVLQSSVVEKSAGC